MAPQPETRQGQRIDLVEEAVVEVRKSMSDEISYSVNRIASEMQQALVAQITSSIDKVTLKLQARIDRVQENNETLISEVTRREEEFQSKMRCTITALKQTSTGQQGELGGFDLGSWGDGLGSGIHKATRGGGGFQGSTSQGKDKLRFGDDPGGGTSGNGGNWRYRKLDLPQFDGTNPDGWILLAERYFTFYRLNEEEKLEAAVVGFKGDALLWYQWEHRRRHIHSWEDMRGLLLQQFRPLHSGTLCEQWLAVKQTGSVSEFKRQFIELAASLERMPENVLMGHFVNGLKEDIRVEVRMLGVYALEQAMELALKVEEKNRVRLFKNNEGKSNSLSNFKSNNFGQYSTTLKSPSQNINTRD